MKLVIIGSGYVGLVTGCCLAEAGNEVVCVDHDVRKLAALREGRLPFHEPELQDVLVEQCAAGRLKFESAIGRAMPGAECVFLCVGTPAQKDGNANLDNLLLCVRELADTAFEECIVVIKSTVPVGTSDRIEAMLNEARLARPGQISVKVASNPEFLAEGRAVRDFRKPDRIVIGTHDPETASTLARLYAPFSENGRRLICMDRRSAEFAKYACNAMLAARISMVNELAGIAGALGADMKHILPVLRTDPRIGGTYLNPGVGYGGSCLPKDLQALIQLANGVGEPAAMLQSVRSVNQHQIEKMRRMIKAQFRGQLRGRTLAIWGLSFKPGTDDVRAAPSLALIRLLHEDGACLKAYDPVANQAARAALEATPVSFHESALSACEDADAMVLMTEWEEFRQPDFQALASQLRGRLIFDGRGLYDTDSLAAHGLMVLPIHKAAPPTESESFARREAAFPSTLPMERQKYS